MVVAELFTAMEKRFDVLTQALLAHAVSVVGDPEEQAAGAFLFNGVDPNVGGACFEAIEGQLPDKLIFWKCFALALDKEGEPEFVRGQRRTFNVCVHNCYLVPCLQSALQFSRLTLSVAKLAKA